MPSKCAGPTSWKSKSTAAAGTFTTGEARVLVTKPSIAGHGMNWQHCARIAFVGVSHSYEQSYQAIRRCWRYGQTQHVDVHLFGSELDAGIRRRVERKEQTAMQIYDNVVERATADTGTATPDRDTRHGRRLAARSG